MDSQIAFLGPEGAMVAWSAFNAGQFDSEPLVAPARSNFPQGALYRLKLTNLPGRPGVELYPTTTTLKTNVVDCIRIRAPQQKERKPKAGPEVPPKDEDKDDDMDDDIPF